ncbi:MAG: hypothetical protein MUC62_02205 [Candidatus Thermoplasmatota archaeon]|jgi:hypothetical protein|nr:hypothetical protein [Candidatus Thermoplasmatota archaeon]
MTNDLQSPLTFQAKIEQSAGREVTNEGSGVKTEHSVGWSVGEYDEVIRILEARTNRGRVSGDRVTS